MNTLTNPASTDSHFELSKWYMDCVSDYGQTVIVYVASLRWRALTLNYSSTFQFNSNADAKVKTSLKQTSMPRADNTSIKWECPALGFSGKWEADAKPIHRTLLDLPGGRIEWNCLQPRARASIHFGENDRLDGFGYVEQIRMTIPPWQLPFDELRWGRFLTEEDTVVWMEWRGDQAFKLVLHNDIEIESAVVTDQSLNAHDFQLELRENSVLRNGKLVETALSSVPGIRGLFPIRILGMHECKWLSRSLLTTSRAETGTGWAIHEVVRWLRTS